MWAIPHLFVFVITYLTHLAVAAWKTVIAAFFYLNFGGMTMKATEVAQVLVDNQIIEDTCRFILDVEKAHGQLTQSKILSGEALKLPLFQIVAGNRAQSAHARKRLEALNGAITYAQTGDKDVRRQYLEAYKQADRLAIAVVDEMRNGYGS